jgi:hypothetical protein
MDRPRVVVGFCRDWIEYADWLEAENKQWVEVDARRFADITKLTEENAKLREAAQAVVDGMKIIKFLTCVNPIDFDNLMVLLEAGDE